VLQEEDLHDFLCVFLLVEIFIAASFDSLGSSFYLILPSLLDHDVCFDFSSGFVEVVLFIFQDIVNEAVFEDLFIDEIIDDSSRKVALFIHLSLLKLDCSRT